MITSGRQRTRQVSTTKHKSPGLCPS
jgi:hypothetical protein